MSVSSPNLTLDDVRSYLSNARSFFDNERILDTGEAFKKVAHEFQYEMIDALADMDKNVFLRLSKGWDKSGCEGFMMLWFLLFWQNFHIAVYAKSRQQTRILYQIIKDAVRANERLSNTKVEDGFLIDKIINESANVMITFCGADSPTSSGWKPDLTVIIEADKWNAHDADYAGMVMGNALKKKGARIWIEANAFSGKNSPFWKVYEQALRTPHKWRVLERSGPAPWHDADKTAMYRSLLTPVLFARLIENMNTDGSSEFCPAEKILACEQLTWLPEVRRPSNVWRTIITTDVGVSNDACAIGVFGQDQAAKTRVLNMQAFVGSPQKPVNLDVVEQLIIQWISTFRPERVIFDPWQAVMMQSHISRFCPTEKFSFQRDLDKMTMDLYQSIVQGAVLFYKDAGKRMHNDGQEWSLKRELLELSVVEGGRSGCRIDHQKDGHSDCVMSLGMALFYFREHSAPILGQATAKPRFFDFRL